MTPAAFRKLALSMPDAYEAPHFERTSFRVGKRIFATMTKDGTEAMVPVTPVERALALLAAAPDVYVDHAGFTRRMGALGVRLARADARVLKELVALAWERVAPAAASPAPRPPPSPGAATKARLRGRRAR